MNRNEAERIRSEKLRWHCRRALLELDIVFQRFWERNEVLDEETAASFERLLEMEDHDLWDVICGRSATGDPHLDGLAGRLRAVEDGVPTVALAADPTAVLTA